MREPGDPAPPTTPSTDAKKKRRTVLSRVSLPWRMRVAIWAAVMGERANDCVVV